MGWSGHLKRHRDSVGPPGAVVGGAARRAAARALVDDCKANAERLAPHVARLPGALERVHPLPVEPRCEACPPQNLNTIPWLRSPVK